MPSVPLKTRPLHAALVVMAAVAVSLLASACGTQKIGVARSDPTYQGAVLFNQHCSGCHTLSYAAVRGSAANVRTREPTNGPNFNVRCERPIARILYAIANGGFSGAIMPQNIVVGQQADEVAMFVAKYAGRQAQRVSGLTPCDQQPVGSIPNFTAATVKKPGNTAPGSVINATGASKSARSATRKAQKSKPGGKATKPGTSTTPYP